jgi:hypothetical protein
MIGKLYQIVEKDLFTCRKEYQREVNQPYNRRRIRFEQHSLMTLDHIPLTTEIIDMKMNQFVFA